MISKDIRNGMEFITVSNNRNLKVVFNNLGASIYLIYFCGEVMTPQVKNDADFLNEDVRFGKNVGRVAGRIRNHTLNVDGVTYDLSCNDGTNTLHGGHDGIATKFFNSFVEEKSDCILIKYSYLSRDKESGFTGDALINIIYKIYKNHDEINISFDVSTSKTCPISLTTHTYFNLGDSDLNNLSLFVNANKYILLSDDIKKDKTILPVPDFLDFREKKLISKAISESPNDSGVDHYLFLNKDANPQILLENNKYLLKVSTDFNSSVFYTDNFSDNYETITSNLHVRRGLAIEPQISCADNLLLKPGEKYSHFIDYVFERK